MQELNEGEVREKLKAHICRQLLNKPDYDLQPGESLVNSGLLDSFAATELLLFIEDAFGVYIPTSELDGTSMDTLDSIVEGVLKWAKA